ncbi:beta-lactamase family protein [Flavobacteriaceae bacterium XHP0103]|uniref:serine hydrolase domain-containing protein n=1 Tax=Marixanthotalea marina TaxID=2844359 RepID=UPI002989A924|nr:serine hydrolase domain-containing protein [Marixanthotalea marina]MBU3821180.1 beta-lactamase family protein [Marixanthotalea marina]
MKRFIASILMLLTATGFSQQIDHPMQQKINIAKKKAKKFLRKQHIPGMAITVSKSGDIIWSEGFGYAKRKPTVPINPSTTLFRIASISKSITAVMLAKLVDDKIIDLDSSIYTYLPNYPKKEYDFTVRELAGHLAGIRSYRGNEYSLNKRMTITEGLDLFKDDPLLFEPSTQFSYNTFGYVLLSEIMQTSANRDYYSMVRDSIFTPLQMKSTTIDVYNASPTNTTNFYKKKRILENPVANGYKVAGGGFLSTSEDITRFGHELIESTLISEQALSQITTSQKFKNGNKTGYGIGLSIEKTKNNTPKYYHTGGGVGASTILMVFPEEDIVITILINKSAVDAKILGETLETIFIDEKE